MRPQDSTSSPPAPVVLVVDKDDDWRATLFDFLSAHGYQVLCAESLERARRFLAEENPPSVVLLCWDLVTSTPEKV
ncbi:MAG: hypothetical protein NVSMB47_16990 [Polyangiales bacterium]